jgi:putative endonuclease
MPWFLYLIECSDDSIYTGITVDVDARYQKHLNGTGARYTRSRPPRRLLATFELADRSSASKAEYRVKRLSPAQKRALAQGQIELPMPDVAHDEMPDETPLAEMVAQAEPT